ncbi:hypothetical protein N7448_001266 [Penicillium atrosanguineum]|nr:hypothetical protein N7448_001266 [Penicillium atrosanguineum]
MTLDWELSRPQETCQIRTIEMGQSQSSFQEPLNFSIASRSSSSTPNTSTTIDFTSFTTDYSQQSWLPTPPPTQPLASSLNNSNNNNNNNNNNSALEDFVLYPAPVSRPQPRPRDLRAPAPSSTALKPSALQPFLAQNNPRRHSFSLQLHRHLQQQLPGSPVPDPRVTKLPRSPSHWSHSSHHAPHNRFSTPPSYTDKQKQRYLAYRRNMSTPNFQGKYLVLSVSSAASVAHTASSENDYDLFGLPSAGFHSGMASPLDLAQLPLDHEAQGAFSPAMPSGTVSPKDLMFETSVPPSSAFTDLSTPPFDSPGTFSQNASPLFTDVDVTSEWPSLFNDGSTLNTFDAEFGFSTVSEAKEPRFQKPALPISPAPKRVVAKASPVSATGSTKHSTVSGISRARKELSPVDFDTSDPLAAKRARNTEAARKSRARKMQRQAAADTQINDLMEQLAAKDQLIEKLKAQLKAQQTYQ